MQVRDRLTRGLWLWRLAAWRIRFPSSFRECALTPQPGASHLSHTANLQTKAFADEYKCSFRNTHLFTHVLPAILTEFKNLNVCNIQLHSSLRSMGKTKQRTDGNFLALVRSVGRALPAKPAGQGPRGGGRERTPVNSLTSTHRGGSHLVPTPAFTFPQ